MEKKPDGLIFNIQRLSIVDGPGGRTSVFLKGCPLECRWCCNPESIDKSAEILLNDNKCTLLGNCINACPNNAVEIKNSKRTVNWKECNQCLKCVDACSARAIEQVGYNLSVDQVIKIVMQDLRYYNRSGGGITISGGEPLLQPEFTLSLFQEAKKRRVHTALDTCGYAQWEIFDPILDYTDLLLYDLKHMDSAKHMEGTGVPNDLILDNLQKISKRTDAKVWIRFPLVSGYNDSDKHIKELCGFVKDLGAVVEQISLLPYHNLGESKYASVGREYQMPGTRLLEKDRIEEIKKNMESEGFNVTTGGGR